MNVWVSGSGSDINYVGSSRGNGYGTGTGNAKVMELEFVVLIAATDPLNGMTNE